MMIRVHHIVTEASCLLALHVQRDQELHQQLQVMHCHVVPGFRKKEGDMTFGMVVR